MKLESFGIVNQMELLNENDQYIEELQLLGFTIIEKVLTEEQLLLCSKKLDEVYERQKIEFTEKGLQSINELYLARLPFIYDDYFVSLFTNERLLKLVKSILGEYFVLHLQNGIINMPQQSHHQSSWHRDLPYQDFTISKPLAISALFCIDDFNDRNGGTIVLSSTHKTEKMPSNKYLERHSHQITANAGSVIIFDAMLFHKAGYNSSNIIRRGVNHMFTSPILKQQINIPKILNGKYKDNPFLRRLFGYDANPADNVNEWRISQMNKIK